MSNALPPGCVMSAAFLPAVAAGALLALVVQSPPSLEARQRLLPQLIRQGIPGVFGSLSHRASRHEPPRVLSRSVSWWATGHQFPIERASGPRSRSTAAAPRAAEGRLLLTSHRQNLPAVSSDGHPGCAQPPRQPPGPRRPLPARRGPAAAPGPCAPQARRERAVPHHPRPWGLTAPAMASGAEAQGPRHAGAAALPPATPGPRRAQR